MGTYIVRRVLQMIPVIILSTFLIYAMVFALPGDPTQGMCGERQCQPAFVEQFRAQYNLDDPLVVQYAKYMGNVLRGDLGTTYSGGGIPVADELAKRYLVTLRLGIIAILFESVIGILAGVLTALRKGKFLDNLVLISTLVVISIPTFVIGTVAQYVIGIKLGWARPTVSYAAPWNELILPGLVLGSISLAYVTRLMRTNLSDNLRADYLRTATAKGLTRQRAIGIHALRNSLIPVVTFIGFDFGALLGGAIITEMIFNIQGVGGFVYRSIFNRDGAAVVGTVTVLVIVYLLVNLLVDLLYGLLDPRISHD